MNTQTPEDKRLSALMLALHARLEPLAPDDQRELEASLRHDPGLAGQVGEMTEFLDAAREARVPARPAFHDRLRREVTGWVRDDVLSRPPVSVTANPLRRLADWLLGRDGAPNVSSSTLVLGRSLAVYLGVATAVCLFLLLKSADVKDAVVDPGQQATRSAPEGR